MDRELEIIVDDTHDGVRLDAHPALVNAAGSRNALQRAIREGGARVDGRERPGRHRVRAGARIQLRLTAAPPTLLEAEAIDLDIVYEDDAVVVVHKPSGMVVHPAPGHRSGTLVNALLHHLPDLAGVGTEQRPGLVHRLDRDTSGLLVVARTTDALRTLQKGFSTRAVRRRYLALALGRGTPDHALVETPYGRHPRHRKRFTSKSGDRTAITELRTLWRGDRAALVLAELQTGRTHQIRVHLAESGHPVVGDPIYGRAPDRSMVSMAERAEVDLLGRAGRLMLHAATLSFPHPSDGRILRFAADPPEEFVSLMHAWMGEAEWSRVSADVRAQAPEG